MIAIKALLLMSACVICHCAEDVSSEVWMKPNTLTKEEIDAILKTHNDYRATIGASNMLKLRWNKEIADLAEGHAQKCKIGHVNQHLPNGMYVGQNLFMSSVPIDNVANGVKAWISEEKNYDFNKLECRKEWWHCGHLTQVITAKTEWLGCAVNRDCPGKWKTLMVCNYQTGNWPKTIKKGPACSACPGATCDNGLCACNNPFCGKYGNLDISTCQCDCAKGRGYYQGAACNQETCPGKDQNYCGKNGKLDLKTCQCSCAKSRGFFKGPKCDQETCPGKDRNYCGRHGRLDLKTCKCQCDNPFSGETCQEKSCKPDPGVCGRVPNGFPKSYCKGKYAGFMAKKCPVMCGVCSPPAAKPTVKTTAKTTVKTTAKTTAKPTVKTTVKTAEKNSCKPDPRYCGPERPYGYPKSFCKGKKYYLTIFMAKTCPVMCGVCGNNWPCPGKGPEYCGRHGKLDLKTCECQCDNPYSGETCHEKSCKPDPAYCGRVPNGFPKSYCKGKYAGFMAKKCPVMCGVC